MLDAEKEESRDVPGLALSISLPKDVSFNFLAIFPIAVLLFPGLFGGQSLLQQKGFHYVVDESIEARCNYIT